MTFSISFGNFELQNPSVHEVDWSTPASEDLLLSEKTVVQVSTQSRIVITVAGVTRDVGHITALKALRGTTATLTIVETPDILGLNGVYPSCSIVAGPTVAPFGADGAAYTITFGQDTS